MEPQQFFLSSVSQADRAVHEVATDDLARQTPCSDWNLKQLLAHMVYELAWLPDLLAGKTVAEVGDIYEGDLLGGAPGEAWEDYKRLALGAALKADPEAPVHLSYGDVSARHYLLEIGTDMLVHGWDVARSLRLPYDVDERTAKIAYDFMQPREADIRASGLFGRAVQVPDDASTWHKMLALYGRQPQ